MSSANDDSRLIFGVKRELERQGFKAHYRYAVVDHKHMFRADRDGMIYPANVYADDPARKEILKEWLQALLLKVPPAWELV